MISRWALFILTLGVFTIIGCSRTGVVPVTVIVTMDGEPLPVATVTLNPETSGTGSSGTGTTDTNGKATIVNGQGERGLAPGQYRTVVSKTSLKAGPGGIIDPSVTGAVDDSAVKQEVPSSYSDPQQSTLVYTVENGPTTIEIKLKSKGKK